MAQNGIDEGGTPTNVSESQVENSEVLGGMETAVHKYDSHYKRVTQQRHHVNAEQEGIVVLDVGDASDPQEEELSWMHHGVIHLLSWYQGTHVTVATLPPCCWDNNVC